MKVFGMSEIENRFGTHIVGLPWFEDRKVEKNRSAAEEEKMWVVKQCLEDSRPRRGTATWLGFGYTTTRTCPHITRIEITEIRTSFYHHMI